MTSTLMKKEDALVSPAYGDHTALLKFLIKSLPAKALSRAELNENLRQLESLRIAIQGKLASHVH